MTAGKVVVATAVAALVLMTGSPSRGLGTAPEVPPTRALTVAAADTNVVIVQSSRSIDAALAAHAFVVLRRGDGSVPRAYLWDEPLGCPEAQAD